MPTRLLVYPIEPGFVWLKQNNGVWGGWREAPANCGDLQLVDSGSFGGSNYQIYFCYADDAWSGRVKWAGRLEGYAEHYNVWGLPAAMEPWEAETLTRLLPQFAIKPEKVTLSESQAA